MKRSNIRDFGIYIKSKYVIPKMNGLDFVPRIGKECRDCGRKLKKLGTKNLIWTWYKITQLMETLTLCVSDALYVWLCTHIYLYMIPYLPMYLMAYVPLFLMAHLSICTWCHMSVSDAEIIHIYLSNVICLCIWCYMLVYLIPDISVSLN